MTRPLTNTVQYFFHSTEHGKTIFILENRFGVTGYCFWFKLLEMLGNTENHYLDLNDELTFETLQAKAHIEDSITTSSLLDLLAKLQAIDPELWESKIVWSQNFVDGLEPVYKNRKRDLPTKPITTSRKAKITGKKPAKEGINTSSNPTRYIGSIGNIGNIGSIGSIGSKEYPSFVFSIYNLLNEKADQYRPNRKKSAKDKELSIIDKIIRIDRRDSDECISLLEWYPIGEKFMPEILCATSLREKYEKLQNAKSRWKHNKDNQTELDAERESELNKRRLEQENIIRKELCLE